MPFTLFCHLKTPKDALAFFDEHNALIEGDDLDWTASYTFPGGLMRKKKTIAVRYDRAYCTPPNWPTQIAGMQNFLTRWPMADETRERLFPLIRSFAFCLGVVSEPEITKGDDPRLQVLNAIAEHMGAVFFTPGAILDSQFRPIVSADGEAHPDAVMPEVPKVRIEVSDEIREEIERNPAPPIEDDRDEDHEPPTADRVAKRFYAMLAIAARGLIEMNLSQGNTPAYSVQELHEWFESLDIAHELEPLEQAILYTPAGQLEHQDTTNSVWSLEGLVVLAWALGLYPMPRYDQLVEVDDLTGAVSLLDAGACRRNIAQAKLRPATELAAYNNQIFAQNWRMVNYRVRPEPVDYANVVIAGNLFDLSWATLREGDLTLRGTPIAKADPGLLQTMNSLSVERHQASNWLRGDARLYSRAETNT